MSDVSLPTYRDLQYPALLAVKQLGGSASVAELDETVMDIAGVTEEQLSVEYPEGSSASGPKALHRMRWALSYLKSMEALTNSERGVWTLTQQGADIANLSPNDAQEWLRAADNKIRTELRNAKKLKSQHSPDQDEPIDVAEEEVERSWKDQLLDTLKEMNPLAFERLAMRLLREAGFTNVEITVSSGDGGIDGVGVYRPSLVSFPIYFQCKRYKDAVGPGVIRDFRGAMVGRGEKGLVITTGVFTPSARKEATRDGAPPIDLIDGEDLCLLLKEHKMGVQTRMEEIVTVDPAFFSTLSSPG